MVNSTDNPAGVTVEGVSKSFGEVRALQDVDLEIEGGAVFGLLGPNGAGKTTLVRVLTTLLSPDTGRASVAGFDVVRQARQLRQNIGLAGQYAAVDENLTGRENLEMVGKLYHLPRKQVRQRAKDVLERFGLSDAADRAVSGYSGGMRRRLDLGASLVGEPRVLFLDEPTTGLDPSSRNGMWEVIGELAEGGTTIVLTTQYLEEADRLAERIAVIDEGRVIAKGTSQELKSRYGGERLEVTLCRQQDAGEAVRVLAPLGEDEAQVEGDLLTLPVHKEPGLISEVVRRLDGSDIKIDDATIRSPTLDDVFLSLTGRATGSEQDEEEKDSDGENPNEEDLKANMPEDAATTKEA